MPISRVKPSTCSASVLVERFLASIQSTAARLHQKVQECNVIARGMSSIDSPSVPCLQTALLLQSAATGRERITRSGRPLSAAKPSPPRWVLVCGSSSTAQETTPTDLCGFNVIYGVL